MGPDQGQWLTLQACGKLSGILLLCMYCMGQLYNIACMLQGSSKLTRYMRHCHRRDWLEARLSKIASEKLPVSVKLLNERYKHMHALIGECPAFFCKQILNSLRLFLPR